MFFNADGSIKKVTPTFRGVGLTDARQKIQIDRYSSMSDQGVSIAFLDTLNTFKGWKTVFDTPDSWVKYNSIDFGKNLPKMVTVNVQSTTGGIIEIREGHAHGAVISTIKIPGGNDWSVIKSSLSKIKPGVHPIVVVLKSAGPVAVDWLQFK